MEAPRCDVVDVTTLWMKDDEQLTFCDVESAFMSPSCIYIKAEQSFQDVLKVTRMELHGCTKLENKRDGVLHVT